MAEKIVSIWNGIKSSAKEKWSAIWSTIKEVVKRIVDGIVDKFKVQETRLLIRSRVLKTKLKRYSIKLSVS